MNNHATPKDPRGLVEKPFDRTPQPRKPSGFSLLIDRLKPGSDYRSCVKHLEAALSLPTSSIANSIANVPASQNSQTTAQNLRNAVDIFRALEPEHQTRILKVVIGDNLMRNGRAIHLSPAKLHGVTVAAQFICGVADALPKDAAGEVLATSFTGIITDLARIVDHELRGWANGLGSHPSEVCTRALWALGYGYFPFWERRLEDQATQEFALTSLLSIPASESTESTVGNLEPSGWGLIKKHIDVVAPAVFSTVTADRDNFVAWLKADAAAYSAYFRAVLAEDSIRQQAVESLLSCDQEQLERRFGQFGQDIANCLAANPTNIAVQFASQLVGRASTDDQYIHIHYTIYNAFASRGQIPPELIPHLHLFAAARRAALEHDLDRADDGQFAAVGEITHIYGLLGIAGNLQGFTPLMERAGAEMLELIKEPAGSHVVVAGGSKVLSVPPSELQAAEDQRARALQHLAQICLSGVSVPGIRVSMKLQDDGQGKAVMAGFALHVDELLPLVSTDGLPAPQPFYQRMSGAGPNLIWKSGKHGAGNPASGEEVTND